LLGGLPAAVQSAPLTIVNAGFEDTSGQSPFNEFTFGTPVGWGIHDPSGVTGVAGTFVGTLQPNGIDFFNNVAPKAAGPGFCLIRARTMPESTAFFRHSATRCNPTPGMN